MREAEKHGRKLRSLLEVFLPEVEAVWRYSFECLDLTLRLVSMGTTELAEALGVSKGLVSQLAKRGMPTSSPQAAQAWREEHSKPKRWKSKAAAPTESTSPTAKPQIKHTAPQAIAGGDDPQASLERARAAEAESYAALVAGRKDRASPEDLRKLSTTYFAARRNRQTAEDFADQWQHRQRITMLLDEAKELAGRPHIAAKQMLEVMPKTLAPRLHGQPQKAIENALAEWADRLAAILRESL